MPNAVPATTLPTSSSDPFLSSAAPSTSTSPRTTSSEQQKTAKAAASIAGGHAVASAKGLSPEAIARLARGKHGSELASGDKGGRQRLMVKVKNVDSAKLTPLQIVKKPAVCFSPHPRHHIYNPELRVSTSLRPLHTSTPIASTSTNPAPTITPRAAANTSKTTPSPSPLRELVPRPQAVNSTPSTSSSASSSAASPSPLTSSIRGILKRKPDALIRVVANVDEGTRGNAEEFRRGGVGAAAEAEPRRPGMVAKDSFLLIRGEGSTSSKSAGLQARRAGGRVAELGGKGFDGQRADGVAGGEEDGNASDDDQRKDGSPKVEVVSPVVTSTSIESLLDIILSPSSDLLSIEDAYNLLFLRLRKVFAGSGAGDAAASQREEIASVGKMFEERAQGLLEAFTRDVERLIGLPPNMTAFLGPPSPPSTPQGSRCGAGEDADGDALMVVDGEVPPLTSSSPLRASEGSPKPKRQGYSEAEVRHRRAAAGVGQSALKILAYVFNRTELFEVFTEDEIVSVLRAILVIPRTPTLFTPNSKKTYPLAIYVFAHIRVPITCLEPLVEDVLFALTYAVGEGGLSKWGGGPSKKDGEGGNLKARQEGLSAIGHVCAIYPSLFLQHHGRLVPAAAKALGNSVPLIRHRGAIAVGGIVRGKNYWKKETERHVRELVPVQQGSDAMQVDEDQAVLATKRKMAEDEWMRVIQIARDCEATTFEFLKSTRRIFNQDGSIARPAEISFIGAHLSRCFNTDPQWASTAWANLVSLLGDFYLKMEGDFSVFKHLNQLLVNALQTATDKAWVGRFALGRLAWNHAIHAVVAQKAQAQVINGQPMIRYSLTQCLNDATLFTMLSLPRQGMETTDPLGAELVAASDKEGNERRSWIRTDSQEERDHLSFSCGSGVNVALAYTAAVRATQDHNFASGKPDTSLENFDSLFDGGSIKTAGKRPDKGLNKLLSFMVSVRGLDAIKVQGWTVLRAIVAVDKGCSVRPERVLQDPFLNGDICSIETPAGDKDGFALQLARSILRNEAAVDQLPSWGSRWVLHRFFNGLVKLFEIALQGLEGISSVEAVGPWVHDSQDLLLLPIALDDIWKSIISCLTQSSDTPAGIVQNCFKEVNRLLADIYTQGLDAPPSLRHLDGYSPRSFKLRVVQHLLNIFVDTIGEEAFVNTRLFLNPTDSRLDVAAPTGASFGFGPDRNGNPSPAGALLAHIVHSTLGDEEPGTVTVTTYKQLFTRLVHLGSRAPNSARFLGDVSRMVGSVGQGIPSIERYAWEVICNQWASNILGSAVPTKPSQPAPSNKMVTLLLGLLGWPFNSDVAAWREAGSALALPTWTSLLRAAARRCLDKGQDPELVVYSEISKMLEGIIGDGSDGLQAAGVSCLDASLLVTFEGLGDPGVLGPGTSALLRVLENTLSGLSRDSDPSLVSAAGRALESVVHSGFATETGAFVDNLGKGAATFFGLETQDSTILHSETVDRMTSNMDFATWVESANPAQISGLSSIFGAVALKDPRPLLPFVQALAKLGRESVASLSLPPVIWEQVVDILSQQEALKAADKAARAAELVRIIEAKKVAEEERAAKARAAEAEAAAIRAAEARAQEQAALAKAAELRAAEDKAAKEKAAQFQAAQVKAAEEQAERERLDALARATEEQVAAESRKAEEAAAADGPGDHVGDVAFLAEDDESLAATQTSAMDVDDEAAAPKKRSKGKRARPSNLSDSAARKRRKASREASVSLRGSSPPEEEILDCIIVSPGVGPSRHLAKSSSTGMLAAVNRWLPQFPQLPKMAFFSPSKEDFPSDIMRGLGPTGPKGFDPEDAGMEDDEAVEDDDDRMSTATGSSRYSLEVAIPTKRPTRRIPSKGKSAAIGRSSQRSTQSPAPATATSRRRALKARSLPIEPTGGMPDLSATSGHMAEDSPLLSLCEQAAGRRGDMESMTNHELTELYSHIEALKDQHHRILTARLKGAAAR